MTGSRAKRTALLSIALAVATGLSAAAQDADIGGPPRELRQSLVGTPPQDESSPPEPPTIPQRLGGNGPTVQVGSLSTLEGPIVGTLDGNDGLGTGEWDDADRVTIENMLAALPVATDSPLQRLLTRKLLLTRSPPPPGKGTQSFNALRIRKLLEAGMLKEAAAIATNVRVKDDLVTARVQADALLLAGRDEVACGDATAARLQSADEYWIELRAFCYALTNDSALDLTRSVIESQNFQDAAFDAALDAMTGGKPKAPDAIATPSALHLRMFERLKWPVPSVAADAVGLPGVLLALRSPGTPLAAKVALAHDAFDAGVLSGADLAAALDLISFKPQELGAAAAQARGEEPMRGLALIRTALRDENDSDRRAELLSTGLRIGAQNDMFASASDLFGGDATTLVPRPDWDNWSFIMASGLLLAGHADAAEQWSNLIDRAQPNAQFAADRLDIAFALVAPAPEHLDRAQAAMSRMIADAGVSASQAALLVGTAEAMGRPVPADARAQLAQLLDSGLTGRRPPKAVLVRIDEASLKGRRGELVLALATAVGPRGPGDLASDVVVGMVRALRTAGLADLALAFAVEAVLTR